MDLRHIRGLQHLTIAFATNVMDTVRLAPCRHIVLDASGQPLPLQWGGGCFNASVGTSIVIPEGVCDLELRLVGSYLFPSTPLLVRGIQRLHAVSRLHLDLMYTDQCTVHHCALG